MKTVNTLKGFVSLPVLCVGSLALLFVASSYSLVLSNKAKQFQPPELENRTQSFKLVSEQKADRDLVLQFENVSTLTITGYTLALGQERFGADFFPNTTQKGVAPGATEEVRVPLFNLSKSKDRIIVLTIVFEDHTSEGDFKAARMILDRRRGYATQMQHIRTLLLTTAQDTKKVSSLKSTAPLKDLRDRISSLPEGEDTQPSHGVKSGLNFAKQWTLKQIARLESGEMDVEINKSPKYSQLAIVRGGNIGAGLEYIVDQVDEILAKL